MTEITRINVSALLGILLWSAILLYCWFFITQNMWVLIPLSFMAGWFCPEIVYRYIGGRR